MRARTRLAGSGSGEVLVSGFFVILVLVVGGFLLAGWIKSEDEKAKREQTRQRKGGLREKKRSFLAGEKHEWPYASGMSDELDFMMMSSDTSRLRFVIIDDRKPGLELLQDTTIPISNVVNLELKQDTETVTSIDVRTRTKKQGALARAAVGAVTFGGVGAIVGATSAGSTSHSVGSQTAHTKVVGNRIVIGTSDPANPTVVRRFSSSSEAVTWYHRILGAFTTQSGS
jgi:hypothetical protein